jgi:hypothetical protein
VTFAGFAYHFVVWLMVLGQLLDGDESGDSQGDERGKDGLLGDQGDDEVGEDGEQTELHFETDDERDEGLDQLLLLATAWGRRKVN